MIKEINIFGLRITFYAIMILIGALCSYFVAQHFATKHGYKKDILSNCFLLVFPAGVVGARLWYVIANFYEFKDNLIEILYIWNGGLAIQGGVILGALAGVAYFYKYFPKEPKRFWADLIIPNILIAQAIGRWGNFFNQEVYGICTPIKDMWYIPRVIIDNAYNINDVNCAVGLAPLPLFFIEFVINTLGFILITFVLRSFWKRGRKPGDLAALYFIWYGGIRLLLEGLRNQSFIMSVTEGGAIGSTYIMSGLMLLFGIGFMIFNRIIPAPKEVDKYEYKSVLEVIPTENSEDNNGV
jgi:phosphatidylglycerol:prolipoprotein diacylglycerol transferase